MSYPAEGDAWADFLHHRCRVIVEMVGEGRTPEAIAQSLSMDPEQVRRVHAAATDGRGIDLEQPPVHTENCTFRYLPRSQMGYCLDCAVERANAYIHEYIRKRREAGAEVVP